MGTTSTTKQTKIEILEHLSKLVNIIDLMLSGVIPSGTTSALDEAKAIIKDNEGYKPLRGKERRRYD
jgi:hypothetical protein